MTPPRSGAVLTFGEALVGYGSVADNLRTATEGETARSRSFAITPIETVGAGDGFAAGYLLGLLTGVGLQQRLDLAAAVGAIVTTRRGDLTAMPSRTEVDGLLNSTPPQPLVPV